MAVDVLTEIVIERPCETVASYAANPDNAPAWYVNIKSVESQTQPAVSVGSKMAFVAQFLGRRLAYTYEIVEFSPGQRLVMRTAQGPFPAPGTTSPNARCSVVSPSSASVGCVAVSSGAI